MHWQSEHSQTAEEQAAQAGQAKPPAHSISTGGISVLGGLSGKLLVLTIFFVMLAEVLILVPSIAAFRHNWLRAHIDTAEAASIVYLDGSEIMLSPGAQADLLRSTEALQLAIREHGVSRLMAAHQFADMVDNHIDLENITYWQMLRGSFATLFSGGRRLYSVSGQMKSKRAEIHLVQQDRFLRNAMLAYAGNILLISLAISLITAGLVYLTLYFLIVRPIIRLSRNMDDFSKNPENVGLVFNPPQRHDEIGLAGQRLAALQDDLQGHLRHRRRLADLGLAVSKINHDLRNILASAQLFSDHLTGSSDPAVRKFAPKIIRSMDRAIDYTKAVLSYGRAVESSPELTQQKLRPIAEEVYEALGFEHVSLVKWNNTINDKISVYADREQLFRVLLNLCRNALQALKSDKKNSKTKTKSKGGWIEISAAMRAGMVEIRITDNGPGIAQFRQQALFKPFQGSTTKEGSGLGLAIAAEIIRAHGGSIELEKSSAKGTVMLICLPYPD